MELAEDQDEMAHFVCDFASSDDEDLNQNFVTRSRQPDPDPEPEPEPEPSTKLEQKESQVNGCSRVCSFYDPDCPDLELQRQLAKWAQTVYNREPSQILVQQSGLRCTGGWVWQGALELEKYILFCVPDIQRLKILELGAGVGYLAMRLASVGASVMATEQPAMLAKLQTNIAKNMERICKQKGPESFKVRSAVLNWGDIANAEALTQEVGGWDLIIGSDCIYLEEAFQPLLQTIATAAANSGPRCRILLSAEHRVGRHVSVDENFQAARFFGSANESQLAQYGLKPVLVWEQEKNDAGNRVSCHELVQNATSLMSAEAP